VVPEDGLTESGAISLRVQELLRGSIRSIEELEVLLVLRGAVVRDWTAEQLSRELRLPESAAASALSALVLGGLAIQVGEQPPLHYQYRLHAPETEEVVEELAKTYGHHRLEVLMQISSNAIERVRKGALTTFSDAFRLPSRRKDG
jgi:hypothetical protein